MTNEQRRWGYLAAVAGCLLALGFRVLLFEALAEQARLLPFVLPVIGAAWLGGLRPGLLATALGVFLGLWFIVPPANSLYVESLADGLNAAIFVVVGITISLLCEELHAAHRRETEKQFHTLADWIPQLVWMANAAGERYWYNRRWYEYTGADPAGSADQLWQQSHDPSRLPQTLAHWKSAVARGAAWEDTYPLRRSDGQMRWQLARAVPLRDESGQVTCWFGTCTDIEERMEYERALTEAADRKDQFLATLAHELRNPLSPISNALHLWHVVENDPAELASIRAVIERQVRQLVRLIDDLMDLSRISQGKISLKREPLDLSGALIAAVETAQPLIESAEQQLCLKLPEQPIWVNGDATRLTQAFANLLNNASKYSPRGARISLHLERQGEQAIVRVQDSGVGIPPEMLGEIFDAFRQVDSTISRSHGGLGIGLWLTRQLIELHGGTIHAESAGVGQGSQFVVQLQALALGRVSRPFVAPSTDKPIEPHRLLVVDDLSESADTLAAVLRSRGQDATALCDAEAAEHWILMHRPDAVLLDIAMPRLDGYELARRLRAYPELHDLVLVALTGYGQPDDRRRAFAAGFNYHLTKPTHLAALEEMLRQLPPARSPIKAASVGS